MSGLPVGAYTGTIHGPLQFLNRIWTGKVFEGDKVLNVIFGAQMIEGQVTREGETVVLTYPQLFGVQDRLVSLNGHIWHGTMVVGCCTVRFTLERKT